MLRELVWRIYTKAGRDIMPRLSCNSHTLKCALSCSLTHGQVHRAGFIGVSKSSNICDKPKWITSETHEQTGRHQDGGWLHSFLYLGSCSERHCWDERMNVEHNQLTVGNQMILEF